jgi:hypothetical protein
MEFDDVQHFNFINLQQPKFSHRHQTHAYTGEKRISQVKKNKKKKQF